MGVDLVCANVGSLWLDGVVELTLPFERELRLALDELGTCVGDGSHGYRTLDIEAGMVVFTLSAGSRSVKVRAYPGARADAVRMEALRQILQLLYPVGLRWEEMRFWVSDGWLYVIEAAPRSAPKGCVVHMERRKHSGAPKM